MVIHLVDKPFLLPESTNGAKSRQSLRKVRENWALCDAVKTLQLPLKASTDMGNILFYYLEKYKVASTVLNKFITGGKKPDIK